MIGPVVRQADRVSPTMITNIVSTYLGIPPEYKEGDVEVYLDGELVKGCFYVLGSPISGNEVYGVVGVFDPYPPKKNPVTGNPYMTFLEGKVKVIDCIGDFMIVPKE